MTYMKSGSAFLYDEATDCVVGVKSPDGQDVLFSTPATLSADLNALGLPGGPSVVSGEWIDVPLFFRLRLIGTGTVTIDRRDQHGVVTTGVATYTISGATNQIEYPFSGDMSGEIRITLTGSATAEVI